VAARATTIVGASTVDPAGRRGDLIDPARPTSLSSGRRSSGPWLSSVFFRNGFPFLDNSFIELVLAAVVAADLVVLGWRDVSSSISFLPQIPSAGGVIEAASTCSVFYSPRCLWECHNKGVGIQCSMYCLIQE
jgi:hypothetical protein